MTSDYCNKVKRKLRKKGIDLDVGKFVRSDTYFGRKKLGGSVKYVYPFSSTEEAEEYFLGKNPRKTDYYKKMVKKIRVS